MRFTVLLICAFGKKVGFKQMLHLITILQADGLQTLHHMYGKGITEARLSTGHRC